MDSPITSVILAEFDHRKGSTILGSFPPLLSVPQSSAQINSFKTNINKKENDNKKTAENCNDSTSSTNIGEENDKGNAFFFPNLDFSALADSMIPETSEGESSSCSVFFVPMSCSYIDQLGCGAAKVSLSAFPALYLTRDSIGGCREGGVKSVCQDDVSATLKVEGAQGSASLNQSDEMKGKTSQNVDLGSTSALIQSVRGDANVLLNNKENEPFWGPWRIASNPCVVCNEQKTQKTSANKLDSSSCIYNTCNVNNNNNNNNNVNNNNNNVNNNNNNNNVNNNNNNNNVNNSGNSDGCKSDCFLRLIDTVIIDEGVLKIRRSGALLEPPLDLRGFTCYNKGYVNTKELERAVNASNEPRYLTFDSRPVRVLSSESRGGQAGSTEPCRGELVVVHISVTQCGNKNEIEDDYFLKEKAKILMHKKDKNGNYKNSNISQSIPQKSILKKDIYFIISKLDFTELARELQEVQNILHYQGINNDKSNNNNNITTRTSKNVVFPFEKPLWGITVVKTKADPHSPRGALTRSLAAISSNKEVLSFLNSFLSLHLERLFSSTTTNSKITNKNNNNNNNYNTVNSIIEEAYEDLSKRAASFLSSLYSTYNPLLFRYHPHSLVPSLLFSDLYCSLPTDSSLATDHFSSYSPSDTAAPRSSAGPSLSPAKPSPHQGHHKLQQPSSARESSKDFLKKKKNKDSKTGQLSGGSDMQLPFSLTSILLTLKSNTFLVISALLTLDTRVVLYSSSRRHGCGDVAHAVMSLAAILEIIAEGLAARYTFPLCSLKMFSRLNGEREDAAGSGEFNAVPAVEEQVALTDITSEDFNSDNKDSSVVNASLNSKDKVEQKQGLETAKSVAQSSPGINVTQNRVNTELVEGMSSPNVQVDSGTQCQLRGTEGNSTTPRNFPEENRNNNKGLNALFSVSPSPKTGNTGFVNSSSSCAEASRPSTHSASFSSSFPFHQSFTNLSPPSRGNRARFFLAGASNPIVPLKPDWWDLLVDIDTGTITYANNDDGGVYYSERKEKTNPAKAVAAVAAKAAEAASWALQRGRPLRGKTASPDRPGNAATREVTTTTATSATTASTTTLIDKNKAANEMAGGDDKGGKKIFNQGSNSNLKQLASRSLTFLSSSAKEEKHGINTGVFISSNSVSNSKRAGPIVVRPKTATGINQQICLFLLHKTNIGGWPPWRLELAAQALIRVYLTTLFSAAARSSGVVGVRLTKDGGDRIGRKCELGGVDVSTFPATSGGCSFLEEVGALPFPISIPQSLLELFHTWSASVIAPERPLTPATASPFVSNSHPSSSDGHLPSGRAVASRWTDLYSSKETGTTISPNAVVAEVVATPHSQICPEKNLSGTGFMIYVPLEGAALLALPERVRRREAALLSKPRCMLLFLERRLLRWRKCFEGTDSILSSVFTGSGDEYCTACAADLQREKDRGDACDQEHKEPKEEGKKKRNIDRNNTSVINIKRSSFASNSFSHLCSTCQSRYTRLQYYDPNDIGQSPHGSNNLVVSDSSHTQRPCSALPPLCATHLPPPETAVALAIAMLRTLGLSASRSDTFACLIVIYKFLVAAVMRGGGVVGRPEHVADAEKNEKQYKDVSQDDKTPAEGEFHHFVGSNKNNLIPFPQLCFLAEQLPLELGGAQPVAVHVCSPFTLIKKMSCLILSLLEDHGAFELVDGMNFMLLQVYKNTKKTLRVK